MSAAKSTRRHNFSLINAANAERSSYPRCQRRVPTMKVQEPLTNKPKSPGEKQPYEPPTATCVRVHLEERILGCLYSTIRVCGLTE